VGIRSKFPDCHEQSIAMGYLEEIRSRGREANPFFRLMGIDVNSFGEGEAKLSMEVRPDMLNGVGWLQGGLFTALCDEAMALALFTVLEEGERIATISESTSFLQGIREGRIVAMGRVVKKGRRVAFTEGTVANYKGHILSQTSASFTVIRPK
jgi:acyl-CoA thioesterase